MTEPTASGGLVAVSAAGLLWGTTGVVSIGVACTAVAYGLFSAGLRTVPSGVASILALWEPITATVLAVAVLGETLPRSLPPAAACCSARSRSPPCARVAAAGRLSDPVYWATSSRAC